MATSILPPEDEYLATGWEPGLAAEDSLVRQAVLAHAAWAVELGRAAGGLWHDSTTWAGGAGEPRSLFTNWVVPKQPISPILLMPEIEAVIPKDMSYLFVSAWPTPDLVPYGLGLAGHPPLMVRLPHTPTDPPETDLHIHRVEVPDELPRAERVLVEGYPFPELQPFHPGVLYRPPIIERTAVFVAYDAEVPLATACSHLAAGVNLIENVAVMPQARGRGLGAAITWAATMNAPDLPAMLIASDEGQPVYQRLGYLRLERWTVWVRPGT